MLKGLDTGTRKREPEDDAGMWGLSGGGAIRCAHLRRLSDS